MKELTLDKIKAEQNRLAEMISAFEKVSGQRLLMVEGIEIALDEGEHYAGSVLDAEGKVLHHLVLMAEKPDGEKKWADAMSWAASVGGALPNRQEASLIFANCKPHVEAAWHWTSETYEPNASCAWGCDFDNGLQDCNGKVYGGCCRAVRRVNS